MWVIVIGALIGLSSGVVLYGWGAWSAVRFQLKRRREAENALNGVTETLMRSGLTLVVDQDALRVVVFDERKAYEQLGAAFAQILHRHARLKDSLNTTYRKD